MKKFDAPPPVKLVCGILYKDAEWLHLGLQDLEDKFGSPDFQSEPIEFTFTDYYYKEMGKPLSRVFVSFARLIDSADLADVKLYTNSVEEKHALQAGGSRVLNLDPGYINGAAFILATSKNFAHRIYLGKGVFAQQELLFEKKRVQSLDWTYPDYRSYEYQEMLRKIRDAYLQQLR
jgi:Domain of unknown function (DUF4416)